MSGNVVGVPGKLLRCLLGSCPLVLHRLAQASPPENVDSSACCSCRVLGNPVLAWFSKCSVVGSAGEVVTAVSSQARFVSNADRHFKKAWCWVDPITDAGLVG